MKTIKMLLGIIAINLTLITIIQTGIWPSKVQSREFNNSLSTNYGLVPLNENGNISIEGEMDVVEERVFGARPLLRLRFDLLVHLGICYWAQIIVGVELMMRVSCSVLSLPLARMDALELLLTRW